jgi:hypothetical protein
MTRSDKVWKTINTIVLALGGAAITGAISYFGIRAEDSRQATLETNKQVSTLVDILSKQKDLDLDLGMRMFGLLMERYYQQDESVKGNARSKEKMVLLRLIALNFQDVPINLKPLFEQLDGQITDVSQKEELREIAKDVARRQAYRVTFDDGFDSGPTKVKSGDKVPFPNLSIEVSVESIAQDRVAASLNLGGRIIGPFEVSYFDMPIIDNVKLGDKRVSLLLLSTDMKSAEVRLIAFPSSLAMDRFDIKELTQQLRTRNRG